MLHPSRLEQGGLVETLRWYAGAVTGERLTVHTELPSTPVAMPKEAEIVLFRLVQECLNYLVARPGIRDVTVRLSAQQGIVLQIIVKGSLPSGLRDALGDGPENGLTGVRERLRQLGGKLDVLSSDTKSIVETSLPMG
jgi:signal transduction histidine kinase